MRSQDIVGKRVVGITQKYCRKEVCRSACHDVIEIKLDDGTVLKPVVQERDDFYAVDLQVVE